MDSVSFRALVLHPLTFAALVVLLATAWMPQATAQAVASTDPPPETSGEGAEPPEPPHPGSAPAAPDGPASDPSLADPTTRARPETPAPLPIPDPPGALETPRNDDLADVLDRLAPESLPVDPHTPRTWSFGAILIQPDNAAPVPTAQVQPPTGREAPDPSPTVTVPRNDTALGADFATASMPVGAPLRIDAIRAATSTAETLRAPTAPVDRAVLWTISAIAVSGMGMLMVQTRGVRVTTLIRDPRPFADWPTTAPARLPELLRHGQAALDAGDAARAASWFAAAVDQEPRLVVARVCLALTLMEIGRPHQAYRHLVEACNIDSADAFALFHRARAAAMVGRSGDAMDTLQRLLVEEPGIADDVVADAAFATLLDHPRFLSMTGRL